MRQIQKQQIKMTILILMTLYQTKAIAANKIKNKYKKMRAKRNTIPLDTDEIEQADTVNYVDDVSIDDVKQNKNAIIAAKKITGKYKRLARK